MNRWFRYTVIVGALPIIVRLFICMYLKDKTWDFALCSIDFIFLGLTLNLTNLNEINLLKDKPELSATFKEDKQWWSVIAIIFLAINLGSQYFCDIQDKQILDPSALFWSSIILCAFSLIYSGSIIYKSHKTNSSNG